MATVPASARLMRLKRVLYVTLGLNLMVAIAKIIVGSMTGAIAIRADGFHSLTDGLNNVVLLVGTAIAARPPDANHPYGHKKIEIFAAAAVGISLLFVAYNVGQDIVGRLRGSGEPPRIDNITLGVLFVTLAVNIFVALWERREGQRLQSPVLLSDAAHTASDIAVTIGVLGSSVLVRMGYPVLDPVAGVVVVVFITWAAIRILRDNARFLADEALVDPARILEVVLRVPGVASADAIRTRGTPDHVFVDLAVRVSGELTVSAAHTLAHLVETEVCNHVTGVMDVHVHIEPA